MMRIGIISALAAGPIVEALRPIISAVVAATVGIAVTFGVALLKGWTGVFNLCRFASSSGADRSGSSHR
jgi:hypothetical protein